MAEEASYFRGNSLNIQNACWCYRDSPCYAHQSKRACRHRAKEYLGYEGMYPLVRSATAENVPLFESALTSSRPPSLVMSVSMALL
jgi:hypothetical protein